MNLEDYLILGTEFGIFPMNRINGRNITELPADIIDSLMLTLKSNWINWQTIFSSDIQIYKYPVEKENHYLTGRLLTSELQPVASGEILLMSTPGKEAAFQYTRTDKEEFQLQDSYR
jgi:hypothetical protein